MSTMRLNVSQRFTGALWGAIVTATGAVGIALYSGQKIDIELLGIGVLAAIGGWLLLSAIVSAISRRDTRDAGFVDLNIRARELAQSARTNEVPL